MYEAYHAEVETERNRDFPPGRIAGAAIIEQAAIDIRELRFQPEAKNAKHREHIKRDSLAYIEAYLWLASDRTDYDLSFRNICDNLGMPYDSIRTSLKIVPGGGLFGWVDLAERDSEQ